jgi:hypothetical protein
MSMRWAHTSRVKPTSSVFEVEVDDQLLFSKRAAGRHAEPGEVLLLFRRADRSRRHDLRTLTARLEALVRRRYCRSHAEPG